VPVSSGLNKGMTKAEVQLAWDPSPLGSPDHDLDLIAGTFRASDPYGAPAYLVYFGSRSPDGTITLNRDSTTGQGFGTDEDLSIDLYRISDEYSRVVVGVAIQQRDGDLRFGQVANPHVRVLEGYEELSRYDFSGVPDATAATVGEFFRDGAGAWGYRVLIQGFDADPQTFGARMGQARP
jgi:tellurium resistance protein TerD